MFFPIDHPDPSRLDQIMRDDLAASLAHLYETQDALRSLELESTLDHIRSHKVYPVLFGRYFDLVLNLIEDNTSEATRLLKEIIELADKVPIQETLRFSHEELGDDYERYARLVDIGSKNPGFMATPNEESWSHFRRLMPQAIQLIEQADSRLLQEMEGMVSQVIAAAPLSVSGSRKFGAASSMMLWGAIMVNVHGHETAVKLAEGLVHETTHHLLFALSKDEPLVVNEVSDSFDSPLRTDDRPMDGVYHATFVCARLIYFYDCLLKLDMFDQHQKEELADVKDDFKKRFNQGLDVVRENAELTALGTDLIACAEAYVH